MPDGPLYSIDTLSGCWLWRRFSWKGYGVYKGKQAHRVLYEQLVGPIPAGLVLDHLCHRTLCVNPTHLEPVTSQINTHRGHCCKCGNQPYPREIFNSA
jgi:hypothetical protein